jgi:hypothetical protein
MPLHASAKRVIPTIMQRPRHSSSAQVWRVRCAQIRSSHVMSSLHASEHKQRILLQQQQSTHADYHTSQFHASISAHCLIRLHQSSYSTHAGYEVVSFHLHPVICLATNTRCMFGRMTQRAHLHRLLHIATLHRSSLTRPSSSSHSTITTSSHEAPPNNHFIHADLGACVHFLIFVAVFFVCVCDCA